MDQKLFDRLVETRNNLAAALEFGSEQVACVCTYGQGWTLIVQAGHKADVANKRRGETLFVTSTIYSNPTDLECSRVVDFIVKLCEKHLHVCSKAYGGTNGVFIYYLKPAWKKWNETST